MAATGDLGAQRGLVAFALDAVTNGAVSFARGVWQAEPIARMAASHGEPHDRKVLAALLFYMAQIEADNGGASGSTYQAEACAILNGLAIDGDDEAAAHLDAIAGEVGPQVLADAAALETLAADMADIATIH